MKKLTTLIAVISCCALLACGTGGTTDGGSLDTSDELTTREQAEIVASALSSDQGGLGEDIEIIADIPNQATRQSVGSELERDANAFLTVSASLYFYDSEGNLQEEYDAATTDRIDYESSIEGDFTSAILFFQELEIDNSSDLMVNDLLSDIITIDGSHSNRSSYRRINPILLSEVTFDLDCNLLIAGLTVDLTAIDTFPESGTIEGSISGTYERDMPFSHVTKRLHFDFIAVYQGDNTAEVELSNGTIFRIHLVTGEVMDLD